MKLQEYLDNLPPTYKVSIGTKLGNGYLYVGPVEDFDSRRISQLLYDRAKNAASMRKSRMRSMPQDKITKKLIRGLEKALDAYEDFQPLTDREIVETYSRHYGGVAIIVSGDGSGSADDEPETEPFRIRHNADVLSNAIILAAARDLANSYRHGGRLRGDGLTANKFFDSEWFKVLSDVDGKKLKAMIKANPEAVTFGTRGNRGDVEDGKNGEDDEDA